MKVKICGITDIDAALWAIEYGADALGFVFAESKRKISVEKAKAIIDQIPSIIMTVGVFVNEDIETIHETALLSGFNTIQLHGDETKQDIQVCQLPVIKAVGVGAASDLSVISDYPSDYVLLDSPKGKYHGGNGTSFNWSIVSEIPNIRQKVILAGGLTSENVVKAIQIVRPFMVDVSSGVETNGKKDRQKIKEFIRLAKSEEELI